MIMVRHRWIVLPEWVHACHKVRRVLPEIQYGLQPVVTALKEKNFFISDDFKGHTKSDRLNNVQVRLVHSKLIHYLFLINISQVLLSLGKAKDVSDVESADYVLVHDVNSPVALKAGQKARTFTQLVEMINKDRQNSVKEWEDARKQNGTSNGTPTKSGTSTSEDNILNAKTTPGKETTPSKEATPKANLGKTSKVKFQGDGKEAVEEEESDKKENGKGKKTKKEEAEEKEKDKKEKEKEKKEKEKEKKEKEKEDKEKEKDKKDKKEKETPTKSKKAQEAEEKKASQDSGKRKTSSTPPARKRTKK